MIVLFLCTNREFARVEFLLSIQYFYIQTVKYFNNESFEATKYDEYLKSKWPLKYAIEAIHSARFCFH